MIIAGMATIPARLSTLEKVLDSIVSQVDVVQLALNGFDHVPEVVKKHKNIVWNMTTNEMGDANKFLNVEQFQSDYYFSMDDDIIYPSDYIKTYIPYINKGYLVSCHGCDIPNRKINSYYQGKISRSHCLNSCDETFVDICGSGVSGFHTSFLKLKYDRFEQPNMADIWMSTQAHEQGVRRLAIKHEKGWITGGLNEGRQTIYEKHKNDDSVQTEAVNNFKWHV